MNTTTLRKVLAVIALAVLLGLILSQMRKTPHPSGRTFLETTVPTKQ